MPKIEAVLFDMDGVIVDNLPYHVDAWLAFCHKKNLNLDRETFFKELNGKNAKDTFEWFYQTALPLEEIKKLEEEKESLYQEIYKPNLKPAEGLLDFIVKLKANNVKTAVATSSGQSNIAFTLDGLTIRNLFDVIVSGHDVTKGKPNPEIYQLAAAKLAVNPANCWVMEDSLQGIEAGLSAGCRVVGITTSHTKDELAHTNLQAENFIHLFERIGVHK